MPDRIVMYHPQVPGSSIWVERDSYRKVWFGQGWLSFDDPYNGGDPRVPPGTVIDTAELTADFAPAGTAFAEITSQARVDVPLLGQPVLLEATVSAASVTSASSFTVGFCRTSALNALNAKGCRRVANIPLSAAEGEGLSLTFRYVIPALTAADTWTLIAQRDAGTGTFKLEHNPIYGGVVTATAG